VADDAEVLVHATCIAIGATGVLVRGASGSGKSDLALRLLDRDNAEPDTRTRLVSDDQVRLVAANDCVHAHTAPHLANKLEIRGVGIVHVPTISDVPVGLVVDTASGSEIVRMPDADALETRLLGISVPRLHLDLMSVSAVAKVRFAVFSGLRLSTED